MPLVDNFEEVFFSALHIFIYKVTDKEMLRNARIDDVVRQGEVTTEKKTLSFTLFCDHVGRYLRPFAGTRT